MNSNPPVWQSDRSRQPKDLRDVVGHRDYLRLGKDKAGRDIYTLKSSPGDYYAVAEGLLKAWPVEAVKPSEMDEKYKKPRRVRHTRKKETAPRKRTAKR